jgi:hypothetical protein
MISTTSAVVGSGISRPASGSANTNSTSSASSGTFRNSCT